MSRCKLLPTSLPDGAFVLLSRGISRVQGSRSGHRRWKGRVSIVSENSGHKDLVDVLVVYEYLPHYRYGVFKALQEDERLRFRFCADLASKDGSVAAIEPHLLDRFTRLRNVWLGPILVQFGFFRAILKNRPDVGLFVGDYRYLTTWLAVPFAKALGVRVVFWTQGWRTLESGPKAKVRLAFYRLADGLLVYGNGAKRVGIDLGYPGDRITPIGNSVSSSLGGESEEVPPTITKPVDDILRIGAVLRLGRRKRLDLLIDLAAILQASGQACEVVLAGEGDAGAELERLAAAANVSLRLVGAIYAAHELECFYDGLDVCVIPEAAGLSVVQSLLHGIPVVTHDKPDGQGPEVEAIEPGQNGALYQRGSVTDLVRAVQESAALGRTLGKAELAARCRESLSTGGWTTVANARRIADALVKTAVGRS